MTRITRMLLLAAVAALVLALVPAIAAAKRPPVEPREGFTCAEWNLSHSGTVVPEVWAPESGDTRGFDLGTSLPTLCVDLSNSADGSLEFVIDEEDIPSRARTLVAIVKDSHPGDGCGVLNLDLKRDPQLQGTIDVPAAVEDACGGTLYSDTADSLVLMAFFAGREGTTLPVTVTYTEN